MCRGAGRQQFVIPSHLSPARNLKTILQKSLEHYPTMSMTIWQFAGVAMKSSRLIGDPRRTLTELKMHASDVESPAAAANVHI